MPQLLAGFHMPQAALDQHRQLGNYVGQFCFQPRGKSLHDVEIPANDGPECRLARQQIELIGQFKNLDNPQVVSPRGRSAGQWGAGNRRSVCKTANYGRIGRRVLVTLDMQSAEDGAGWPFHLGCVAKVKFFDSGEPIEQVDWDCGHPSLHPTRLGDPLGHAPAKSIIAMRTAQTDKQSGSDLAIHVAPSV
jgi:hypothetical protein